MVDWGAGGSVKIRPFLPRSKRGGPHHRDQSSGAKMAVTRLTTSKRLRKGFPKKSKEKKQEKAFVIFVRFAGWATSCARSCNLPSSEPEPEDRPIARRNETHDAAAFCSLLLNGRHPPFFSFLSLFFFVRARKWMTARIISCWRL